MATLASIWAWVMSDGLLYVSVLLAVSESLAAIPAVKANSIYQAVSNGLKWIKDKLPGKK